MKKITWLLAIGVCLMSSVAVAGSNMDDNAVVNSINAKPARVSERMKSDLMAGMKSPDTSSSVLKNFRTKRILLCARKCTYCGHTECNRCLAEQKKGKKGYCCQCHRTNVMNGGRSSSSSGGQKIDPKSVKPLKPGLGR